MFCMRYSIAPSLRPESPPELFTHSGLVDFAARDFVFEHAQIGLNRERNLFDTPSLFGRTFAARFQFDRLLQQVLQAAGIESALALPMTSYHFELMTE
jgi:hypothetical protein